MFSGILASNHGGATTSPILTLVLLTTGLLILGYAALHDIGFRTVPNKLSIILSLLGVMLRLQQGNLATGLVCGLLMFIITYGFWRVGWIGGADAKLFSASALFIPPPILPTMIISTSLAGGVLAIIYLLGSMFVSDTTIKPSPKSALFTRILQCERRRLRRRGPLPYATAIATGSWIAIAGS